MKIQDPWESFRQEVRRLAEQARRAAWGEAIESAKDDLRAAIRGVDDIPPDALVEATARIRELEQEVARLRGDAAASGIVVAVPDVPWRTVKASALAGLERAYFGRLAQVTGGNVSEIARRAGTLRSHVRGHLRRHGITATGGKSGPPVAAEVVPAPEAP